MECKELTLGMPPYCRPSTMFFQLLVASRVCCLSSTKSGLIDLPPQPSASLSSLHNITVFISSRGIRTTNVLRAIPTLRLSLVPASCEISRSRVAVVLINLDRAYKLTVNKTSVKLLIFTLLTVVIFGSQTTASFQFFKYWCSISYWVNNNNGKVEVNECLMHCRNETPDFNGDFALLQLFWIKWFCSKVVQFNTRISKVSTATSLMRDGIGLFSTSFNLTLVYKINKNGTFYGSQCRFCKIEHYFWVCFIHCISIEYVNQTKLYNWHYLIPRQLYAMLYVQEETSINNVIL